MKNLALLFIILLVASAVAFAQGPQVAATPASTKTVASPAVELAKAVLAAHGGDKLKQMKTLMLSGSVDLTAFNQGIPGTFAMIFAGDKYRIDLNNPMQPVKQIFDGTNTLTLLPNSFKLPPIDRVGFYVLGKIGEANWPITALPDTSKGKSGFRITSPDGRSTDFFVDDKTKQIKSYDCAFDFDGRTGTTSVEIDKYRTVQGVLVPEKFAQRFDLGQITAYCSFKAKDMSVNTEVADDVFNIEK